MATTGSGKKGDKGPPKPKKIKIKAKKQRNQAYYGGGGIGGGMGGGMPIGLPLFPPHHGNNPMMHILNNFFMMGGAIGGYDEDDDSDYGDSEDDYASPADILRMQRYGGGGFPAPRATGPVITAAPNNVVYLNRSPPMTMARLPRSSSSEIIDLTGDEPSLSTNSNSNSNSNSNRLSSSSISSSSSSMLNQPFRIHDNDVELLRPNNRMSSGDFSLGSSNSNSNNIESSSARKRKVEVIELDLDSD